MSNFRKIKQANLILVEVFGITLRKLLFLQVHKLTNQARRQLAKKQIVTDDFMADDLPGGVWKVSSTRDVRLTKTTCGS